MSVIINSDTRVIVQGFTGKNGTLHSEQMMEYGTQIVGGVTPKKGGTTHLGKPVFDDVASAREATDAKTARIADPNVKNDEALKRSQRHHHHQNLFGLMKMIWIHLLESDCQ